MGTQDSLGREACCCITGHDRDEQDTVAGRGESDSACGRRNYWTGSREIGESRELMLEVVAIFQLGLKDDMNDWYRRYWPSVRIHKRLLAHVKHVQDA